MALVAGVSLLACGAPDELSRRDAKALALARERLDDSIDVEETLRTSTEAAKALQRQVRTIVARGVFERGQLDDAGLAALGELRDLVPSVVIVDDKDLVRALDRPALRAFLAYAESDARRATVGPATKQVKLIERTLEDSGADGDTRVPPADPTASSDERVADYLRETEQDVGAAWPALGRRLRSLRESV